VRRKIKMVLLRLPVAVYLYDDYPTHTAFGLLPADVGMPS